jgi:hypothetical protein
MSQSWLDILQTISDRIKEAHGRGESIWFRGQNESWPLRSRLHRSIFDLVEVAGKRSKATKDELSQLVLTEFQTMYQTYGQKCAQVLPPVEQGAWGRVFSMQHYGVATILLDFTESFAVALYMANWNRDPGKNAAIYVLEPLKMNAASHVGPQQIALNDDTPGSISRALTELYHPTQWKGIPDDLVPMELRDRTKLPNLAVTPTAINGRMRGQKSTFVLSSASLEPVERRNQEAITTIVLPASTFEESRDWLELIGFEHSEYFPDVWGISEDFGIRSEHLKRLVGGEL